MIAGLADKIVQSGAFAAQNQDAVAGEVETVVVGGAAFVQTDDPEILPLQVFERAHQVDNARDAQMLSGAGACFHGYRAQWGGATLRQHHAIYARSVGYAQKRTQVLRILHAVQGKDEPGTLVAIDVAGRLEQIFDGEKLLWLHDGNYALVPCRSGKLGQLFAGFLTDAHASLAAFGHQLFQAHILPFARYQDVVKTPPPGSKRFLDRVDAVENFHDFKFKRSAGATGRGILHLFATNHRWHTVRNALMTTSKPKSFTAVLEAVGDKLHWVIARVPFDIAKAWPERNGRRVRGEINGFVFRTALLPEKGGKAYVLLVNKKMQAGGKAGPGDRARFVLEPDLEKRTCDMPVEFERALKGARGLRKYFDSISPSMQKGFTNHVAEPKSAESRRKRADQMAEALLLAMEGEQDPPPILRAAFQRQPLAEAGWKAMTPIKRRNHLLGIYYRQTAGARECRAQQAIEDALCVAKRKLARSSISM